MEGQEIRTVTFLESQTNSHPLISKVLLNEHYNFNSEKKYKLTKMRYWRLYPDSFIERQGRAPKMTKSVCEWREYECV